MTPNQRLFFLALQWVLNLQQFCDFLLNTSCKTYLEPMLPPGSRNRQTISPHQDNFYLCHKVAKASTVVTVACHFHWHFCHSGCTKPGSVKANRREPKTGLGQVFNFRLGCFDDVSVLIYADTHPRLQLKTRTRFSPLSLSLSMTKLHQRKYSLSNSCLTYCILSSIM